MLQQAFSGKPDESRQLADLGALEMSAMAVMIIGLIWLGLYPQPVLDMVQPVLDSVAAQVGAAPITWRAGS